MKNLINKITEENQKQRSEFIKELKKQKDVTEILGNFRYKSLIPKSSLNKPYWDIKELKSYLIKRKNKEKDADLARELEKIKTIERAGSFKSIVINVEWTKSRMWCSNPSAEVLVNKADGQCEFYNSGSISGCGYDKESTAIAQGLNQSNQVLKMLFAKKDKNIKISNHDLFGYGSGYGVLPNIEGGVGVSCYPRIFEKIGYNFATISSGQLFTVYQITKK